MNHFSQHELLRCLPKVDEAIACILARDSTLPLKLVKKVVQEEISKERQSVLAGGALKPLQQNDWQQRFFEAVKTRLTPQFKPVFNGTGVVIHTNLGRSILPEKAVALLGQASNRYSNLEFDLASGKRGSRYALVENLLCELTGAEAALVVNNNAAAVLLSLDTLARGREVIVSRGQLVEIGGSFRIPDVMAKSGATLVEVGATNRTHVHDYQNALTSATALLLRVHTSNFRIVGFTTEVSAADLANLARQNGLFSMEDLGSGSLVDLSTYGFPYEPVVQDAVKAGIDVVTFSGDKLLGGPQAGIIVGKKEIIAKIKRNPLNRALRIDKFTLAALEGVLCEYYEEDAVNKIPTLRMLTEPTDVVKKKASDLLDLLVDSAQEFASFSLFSVDSRVGGGALPEHGIASWAVAITPKGFSVAACEQRLRQQATPVIGRIEKELFLLDVRTVQQNEIPQLAAALCDALSSLSANNSVNK